LVEETFAGRMTAPRARQGIYPPVLVDPRKNDAKRIRGADRLVPPDAEQHAQGPRRNRRCAIYGDPLQFQVQAEIVPSVNRRRNAEAPPRRLLWRARFALQCAGYTDVPAAASFALRRRRAARSATIRPSLSLAAS
jgi:hypothetical protein